ncbi:MAG TPA: DUF4328 domain-containing protein [Pseudogracilibacillus sp.]|nr:DUF4328 domain-containing protein [Pseudogracilibacillus sp.]
MQEKSEKEKDLLQKNKTRATIFLIGILLISVVLFLISIPMGIRFGEYDPQETIDQLAGVDAVLVAVYALLNLVWSVIRIVFIVFFFIWLYRAYAHLQEQHVTGLAHTPRWAIGWYFIPVMNLYKPFSVMRELTLASFHAVSNPDHWKLKKAPAYIIVWWLLFLGGNIAFLFDLLIDYEAIGDYRRDALIGLFAHPMYVGALLALYVIMKNITQTQTQTINKES